jgi:uncharacterized protein (DUF433 family)
MTLTIQAEPVPLRATADGVILVAGTRVTLDTVVAAFREGATPEEIAQRYPTLELADLYAVIGYILRRRAEVHDYLRRRAVQAGEVRRENESRFDPQGVRERLLARAAGGGRRELRR